MWYTWSGILSHVYSIGSNIWQTTQHLEQLLCQKTESVPRKSDKRFEQQKEEQYKLGGKQHEEIYHLNLKQE